MRILGLAGSLRSAVTEQDAKRLVEEIDALSSREAMQSWLQGASTQVEDGRTRAVLSSNSDAALAAGLWAACDYGADIGWRSLAWHFRPDRTERDVQALRDDLLAADAILVSGPVYFGDRTSLVQDFVSLLRSDPYLREAMSGCFYGGITVGAKRNGGQETALIYQLMDMIDLGLIAVGNDSETTAQYGGTGHAGTPGTMHEDAYGIGTAMGMGRRLARLLLGQELGRQLADKVRVSFLVLQDSGGVGVAAAQRLSETFAEDVDADIIDVTAMDLRRCNACDVCPGGIGPDEDYRCRLCGGDAFTTIHERLLDRDVIVPVMVSTKDYTSVRTSYQVFMERTRYLRRGDYAMSDCMVVPMALNEAGAGENLAMRAITSLIRHHTVIDRPLRAAIEGGRILSAASLGEDFLRMVHRARVVAASRLAASASLQGVTSYNPVGYVLSSDPEKDRQDMGARRQAIESRQIRQRSLARRRLSGGYPL